MSPASTSWRATVAMPAPGRTVMSTGPETGMARPANHASQSPRAMAATAAATKRCLTRRIVALDQPAHALGERSRRVGALVDLADRPHVDQAVGEEDLLGGEHVGPAQVALLAVHLLPPQQLAHALALRTDYAAAREVGGEDAPAGRDEDVAHRALDHAPLAVGDEAFGDRGVVPLAAGEHVLQAIERLGAGQARLLSEGEVTTAHAHARGAPFRRVVG